MDDGYGHSVDTTPSQAADYARPGQIRPNNDANLAENMVWNTALLGLTQESGPNGATSSLTYDSYGRTQTTTSPDGAVTTYAYTNSQAWLGNTTIAQYLSPNGWIDPRNGNRQFNTAAAQLLGDSVYFATHGVSQDASYNLGLVIHELLHVATGQNDSDLLGRLHRAGYSVNPNGLSVQISRIISDTCYLPDIN